MREREIEIKHTCTMSAFPAPHDANTAQAALFTRGKVKVTRDGGGLGESVIEAISFVFSYKGNRMVMFGLI